MDPARRAMITGQRSPSRRDATSPRVDPNNRVSKSSRQGHSRASGSNSKYLSADEQSRQFVADEDKFVLKQAKKKADIRVRDGRARPIDFLAFNLRYADADRDFFDENEDDLDIDIRSPTEIIQALSSAQLSELDSDIASYHVLETSSTNREYWDALRSLCADQKAKIDPRGTDGRVVSSVAEDIDKILAPKTYEQLEGLEKQIRAKLRGNEEIDTDYWEQLLHSLLGWKSRATLARIYDETKTKHEELRKARGPVASGSSKPQAPTASDSDATATQVEPTAASTASAGNDDVSQATMALYHREAARGVTENEEIFTGEEAVASGAKPQWADKHRARKPMYFNRVQMGYEWNKYNQTHYDHDNPPPKVVQGYKFNVFYPELLDKTKAPTFKIIREHGRKRGESFAAAGEEDTCLIRFVAGPPYEDVAFRIVDREWDYSAKKDRGFRSSFDKGILQLHFQFKKIFYRK